MSLFGNSLHVLNRFSCVWLLATLCGIFRAYNCGMPQASPVKQERKLLQRRESWEEPLEPEVHWRKQQFEIQWLYHWLGCCQARREKLPSSWWPSVASAGEPGLISVWEIPLLASQLHFRVVHSLRPVLPWDPMGCSTPGFPVLQHLPELAQAHVHWVGDAIQLSSSVAPFSSCPQSFHISEVYLD